MENCANIPWPIQVLIGLIAGCIASMSLYAVKDLLWDPLLEKIKRPWRVLERRIESLEDRLAARGNDLGEQREITKLLLKHLDLVYKYRAGENYLETGATDRILKEGEMLKQAQRLRDLADKVIQG